MTSYWLRNFILKHMPETRLETSTIVSKARELMNSRTQTYYVNNLTSVHAWIFIFCVTSHSIYQMICLTSIYTQLNVFMIQQSVEAIIF